MGDATVTTATAPDPTTVDRLSDALADAFRTGDAGDVFTDDVFLDGHPPFWRFQIQGIGGFGEWLRGYVGDGHEIDVVRTVPTVSGFVTVHSSAADTPTGRVTSREILLCEVRDGRVAELTVFCNGDWDGELRARHAAEAPMLRP